MTIKIQLLVVDIPIKLDLHLFFSSWSLNEVSRRDLLSCSTLFLLSSNSSSIYLILCEYTIQEISSFTFYNINPLTEAPYFAFVCGNPLYTKKPFNIFTHTHCNYR